MTLGSHQSTVGKSQAHITPRWLIDRLGPFDLDPCAADPRPWDCASVNYTADGLDLPWAGRVWLNPPFDRYVVGRWIERMAEHRNGIALLHARTETEWFLPCWERAHSILFFAHRIKFCRPDGTEQGANSGAPPVLVSFSPRDARRLADAGIPGAHVRGWQLLAAKQAEAA